MEIEATSADRNLLLELKGELDHHGARDALRELELAIDAALPKKLVLDFSGVTFMDSSGLAVVLHLHRTCARSGREFVVRGAPPQPMRVFEASGLPQVMIFERGE